MSVSLIVPYRPGSPARERAWAWVRRRYRLLYPDWQMIVADAEGPWSRARALNAGVKLADGEVFVLADVDCFVDAAKLERLAAAVWGWGRPADQLVRLRPEQTEEVLASDPAAPRLPTALFSPSTARGGGGIVVIHRDAWEALGGFDERFEGWGAEDNWLARRLRRTVGEPIRYDGVLYHLHHERPHARKETAAYRRNVELLAEEKAQGIS